MKVPKKINTLYKLCKWAIKYKPKLIEIGKDCKLRQIRECNPDVNWSWSSYRGIPIKYL